MIPKFKIIPGFNNRFLATSEGKIYDTKDECFLELKLCQGRYRVTLKGHGRYQVHRLIALAYYGEPPFEDAIVHHCSYDSITDTFNPVDNRPQMLVYLTRAAHSEVHGKTEKMHDVAWKLPRTEKQLEACSENGKKNIKKAIEASAKLPRTEKQLKSCKKMGKKYGGLNSKKVVQYTLKGEFITIYSSLTNASMQTNININGICGCCRGKRKTAGKHMF